MQYSGMAELLVDAGYFYIYPPRSLFMIPILAL